ncbi:hypothetical protein F511_19176 [Dorcoceras hygrometricum]|uniref:Uncharacterized protein n=1 Tax=Dorcoceras hygrometricum TaxID=472368 RepID=A0A2Z7A9N1_9LAMI|nr:hypothetical protein F511_19176 [Dorcoceras hygrometricum]
MVDKSQKKAKGFAAQIGALLKSIPAIPMGNGVSFPSAKVLSMRTVHTYTVTNSTIDARTEGEEQGMANAPFITKKRRTGKSKLSVSQAKLDIVQVATDIEPIQVVDPTPVEETVPPLVFKRKSRKRKLVLSRESDDDSVGTEEISKKADDVVVMSSVEADIARVLEETLALGVTETVQESQAFDEALFEEDFTRWLDDFIARHTEPEVISTNIGAQATGSTTLVIDKEVPMSIDDLLIQISNDLLLPTTAAEVTMLRLGTFSSSGDKGKAKLGEDEQVTDNAAMKLFALISRDVEVLVQVRDSLMQAVVDFFASFSLNSMPDMETLKDLKEKERLMMAWAETNSLAIAVRRQLYVLIKYRESLLRTILESFQSYLTPDLPWTTGANLMNGAWTPVQGPTFLSSRCHLSLFLDNLAIPAPAIQGIFVTHISLLAPDQYWASVPWLIRIWRWAKVCEEVVEFGVSGSLRRVRPDVCHAITVHNLGVERIPAAFLRLFAQGLACNNFVDSVCQKDLGETEEVASTGVEERSTLLSMICVLQFPSAKVLSMRTVHTYTVTNSTIDARTEGEEQGMANAPIITKKRRTGKSKLSVSQAKLDIVQVATDIEPIQVVDPTPVEETVPPLVFKRKSRKRKLVLSRESDDDSVGTEEISKKADDVVVMSSVEADIARVLEETLALGVTETVQESQAFDEALFEEDFTRWLDDFIARHTEPEVISTNIGAQATGSTTLVIDKEVPMSIDDLLIQISNDRLLPTTAAEVTMLRLGTFSSSGDKGKAKLGEDDQVTDNAAMKLFALISRDVEVLVQVRDSLMQAVVDFFASFSLNSMPDMETLKDLKEKERLMMAWAETNSLAIAVRRQLYVLIKYRESLLRTILESFQSYLTPDLPWSAMAIQIANLLSVAHSQSLEDLKAQQQELNVVMMESQSSLPIIDYTDSGEIRLAHFFSIADSSCWVRPVFLMNGAWTPVQGPTFWSSRCHLSLFLDNLPIPAPAIQGIFVTHISLLAPDQYWASVPWLIRIWRWAKVCEEVVEFGVSGSLRPVRQDVCHAITVHNLGVERITAAFIRLCAQGLDCNTFADSVCQKDLGDTEEVASTGVEEVDLVSSDVSTVYCSPSPPSPEVDSFEHDMRFALGPTIFSRTAQEERLYFVQSPDSPPAVSPAHESSSSSTNVSLHFDSTDVPVHDQAAPHAPTSVDSTKLAEILEDLQSSLTQHILTSNSEMFSKLNAVEMGIREDLFKMQTAIFSRTAQEERLCSCTRSSCASCPYFTDLKKGLLGPVGIIFGDLMEIKKKQREQDAKQQSMDEQIAAIRNEHLEFQSKIAADMLSLSTQVGDIADFLRSGVAKKGEVGSSSRPTTVRAPTQTLPPTTGTFEERVAQARRNIIEAGQVISVEEVAARVVENDRREHERLERERRDRRQSRSGTYKRRR